jgi:hypothetical protein
MSTSTAEIGKGSMQRAGGAGQGRVELGSMWQRGSPWQGGCAWQVGSTGTWREASLNWLALGLLLAAWNASDNDASAQVRRPEALRGYSSVSVRAAQRTLSANFTSSPNS